MQTCIVRQPIIAENKEAVGYEILYQDNSAYTYNQNDTAAANAIEDFLLQLNSDKFFDGKTAYFTFTPNLLIKNIPKIFSPQKLVIQVEDNSLIHPLAQKIVYKYKKQGYKIAIKDFEFKPRFFAILDIVDIMKIDFSNPDDTSLKNIVNIGKSFKKEIIAYNVNTRESYSRAKQLGCNLMQGVVVAEASQTAVHRMDHMQSNFFQLIVEVTKDEPDIDEIATIISRDVTLAFSLIKLVNSAYFALRNQAKSVKQALIVLGLGQLKQWVYLLSFKKDGSFVPTELIKISFLRANFASELLQYAEDMPISKSEAYLMGMFSTLGALMEVPLEKALAELSISDDIKTALISREGRCGILYNLILSYETADWKEMTDYASQLGIPNNIISQKYFECVEYVNGIWHDLMLTSDEDDSEKENEKSIEKDVRAKMEKDSKKGSKIIIEKNI